MAALYTFLGFLLPQATSSLIPCSDEPPTLPWSDPALNWKAEVHPRERGRAASRLTHVGVTWVFQKSFIRCQALPSFGFLLLIKQLIVPRLSEAGKQLIVQHLQSSEAPQSMCEI